ncbi:MAG TPA: dual specificity protein phosphatase family protein [Candidatus Kryptonia bacterium]|nr:dual specificity protein phosphatase family protein [Candidatus Kryptonia bacterium]
MTPAAGVDSTYGVRRLRPHLYFGPSVHPIDLPRLRRAGITAVLSLQQPGIDLPQTVVDRMRRACAPHDIAFFNIGIHDYDPEAVIAALPATLTTLGDLIRAGRVVYVHCTEGINRAPSVALAHLVRDERLDVDIALAELQRCDAGVRPYGAVIEWLRQSVDETTND